MSLRCRQDLIGCKGRLQSSLNSWREAIAAVEEVWKDETAARFFNDNLIDTDGMITRMMVALQEGTDLLRSIERKVAEPEY